MEQREEEFQFADRKEQIARVNQMLVTGFAVFYLFTTIIVWIERRRANVTMPIAILITVVAILSVVLLELGYMRNHTTTRLKYFALIGLVIVLGVLGTMSTIQVVRVLGMIPFIACILFFDRKYMQIGTILIGAIMIAALIAQRAQGIVTGVDFADAVIMQSGIVLGLFLINRVGTIAAQFNTDTIQSEQSEQQKQKTILKDVIGVAEQVKAGTESAMEIVNELNASTQNVNQAMHDISDSTHNTAESIQDQTAMTQDIQQTIQDILNSSEHMVDVAKDSGVITRKTAEIMSQVKEHSGKISEVNASVLESMNALREKTESVKGIADTIFSISAQTNLLALNASIESARAGEAGRGFAVVADEIRQLAEETRSETERIASILKELSENAEQAGASVNESVSVTRQQDEMLGQAAERFAEMNSNVDSLISEIESVDGKLNGLSKANNQIVDNITNISATTQEVTAASAQAATNSVDNLKRAEEAKNQLDQVLTVSHELDKYTSAQ